MRLQLLLICISIKKVCDETVIKPRESKEHIRSRKIDSILTGKYTAIPAFIGIMAMVFWLTFNVIGAWLSGILETIINWGTETTAALLEAGKVNEVIKSLVIDGVFNGVGSVLSFLPVIVTLFFFFLYWKTVDIWQELPLLWISFFVK